jgi:O-antigen/teichoic acid export membrane protein
LAFRTSILCWQPYIVVSTIATPALARAHAEGDLMRQQWVVTRIMGVSLAGSLLLCMPILIFAPQIMALFGDAFVAGSPALRILVLGALVSAVVGPGEPVLQMKDLERTLRNDYMAFLGTAIILNMILIPLLGMNGAAMATALNGVALHATMAWQVRRATGLDITAAGLRFLFR